MLGQILGSSLGSVEYYTDEGGLSSDPSILPKISKTWQHTCLLEKQDVEYAKLFVGGKSLGDSCPGELKRDWEDLSQRMEGFFRSFRISKMNNSKLQLSELIPDWLKCEFLRVKNEICDGIFRTKKRPDNYAQLSKIHQVVYDLNRNYIGDKKIVYNMFGTKTGRLVTEKDSFPILNLPKDRRHTVKPSRDFILEIDYNAMEPRVLLGLNGIEQPDLDVHSWIAKNVFKRGVSREDGKVELFKWMYGGDGIANLKLDKIFNKERILERYYKGGMVVNEYGREVRCDKKYLAMSYIIQSTSNDLFFEQVYKVREFLRDRKSKIYFCIHDSLAIDLVEDEVSIIEELLDIFENTKFGKFKTKAKLGRNYGELEEV